MDELRKCPICGASAGVYRLGACSIECDRVMGDDPDFGGLVALVVVIIAVVTFLLVAVLR